MPPLTLQEQLLQRPKSEANKAFLNPDLKVEVPGIITSLKKYREFAVNLPKAYENYIKEITNNADEPELFANEQMDKIQEVIQSAEKGFNITRIRQAHDMLKQGMDITQLTKIDQSSLFCGDLFRVTVDYLAPRTKILGDLEHTNLDPETVDKVFTTIKAYIPSAEELGVSEETMKQVNVFADSITSISTQMVRSGIVDDSEPLGRIYTKGTEINNKIRQYLITGDESVMPTTDDFLHLLTNITDQISARPLYEEDSPERDVTRGMLLDFVKVIGGVCPELSTSVEPILQAQAKKEQYDVDKLISDIETGSLENEDDRAKIALSFDRLDSLARRDVATEQEMERLRMIRMARDPEFRESEKQRALNGINSFVNNINYNKNPDAKIKREVTGNIFKFPVTKPGVEGRRPDQDVFAEAYKIYMQATFIENEIQKAANYNNAPDTYSKLKSESNPAMAELLSGKPLSEQSINYLDNVLDNFNGNEMLKEYLQMSPAAFKAQIEDNPATVFAVANEAVRSGDKSIRLDIDDKTLKTLSQDGKNSKEYNNIAKAIAETQTAAYKSEGNLKEYKNLYDTLKTYVDTHDSRPFHDYGKERFNSAAILMGELGDNLAAKNPEMAEQINKDIKVLMLRNKPFRDQYLKEQQNSLTRLIGNKKLSPEVYSSLSPETQKRVKDITDKLSFGVLADGILSKESKYGQISGKLGPKDQEKLLQKFGSVTEYSNGLVTDKVSLAAECNAIKDLFNGRSDADITTEVQQNLAKMVLKQNFIDVAKKDPKTFKDIEKANGVYKKIDGIINDPKQLDNFIKSDNFQIFFNGLGKSGVEKLVNDPAQTAELLKGFNSIAQKTPEQKTNLKYMNIAKMHEDTSVKFSLFFKDASEDDKKMLTSGASYRTTQYSVGRTALESLTIASMLSEGYDIEDIINPYKLDETRQKFSKDMLEKLHSSSDEDFIKFAQEKYKTGMEKLSDYVDKTFKDLPDTSLETLSQDKYAKLFTITNNFNDMGQEFNKHIKNDPIIDKQVGVNMAIKAMYSNKLDLIKLSEGQCSINPDELGVHTTTIAVTDKVMEEELKNNVIGKNVTFSEAFKAGTDANEKLRAALGLATNPQLFVTVGVLNGKLDACKIFAKKTLDGKMFEDGDISILSEGGFSMVQDVKGFNKKLGDAITQAEKEQKQKAKAPSAPQKQKEENQILI